MEGTASYLLDLPRELRDLIYDYAALGERCFALRFSTKPTESKPLLAVTSGLATTCRQVYMEYPRAFMDAALSPENKAKIVVLVTNFNFHHIIRHLQLLNPESRIIVEQKLHIALAISHGRPHDVCNDVLDWLAYSCWACPLRPDRYYVEVQRSLHAAECEREWSKWLLQLPLHCFKAHHQNQLTSSGGGCDCARCGIKRALQGWRRGCSGRGEKEKTWMTVDGRFHTSTVLGFSPDAPF